MLRTTKKAAIYDYILNKLLDRHFQFGEEISVKALGEETGVSRQPIMTALNNLQERGFVKITPQVGCTVANPSPQDVSDFYQMFAANEGLITSLASQRARADEILRLDQINEKIENINPSHSDAELDYRQLNLNFHHHLHSIARSPLVSDRQRANFELSDFFIVQSCGFSIHLAEAGEEHDQIIQALETRDPEAARLAAQTHIENIARQVVSSLSVP